MYATTSAGADHMAGDYYEVIRGRIAPEFGLDLIDRFAQDMEVAKLAANTMDYRSFTNAAIMCHFEDVTADNVVGLLRALTGWEVDYGTVMQIGERISVFKRALNFRLGPAARRPSPAQAAAQADRKRRHRRFCARHRPVLSLYYQARNWDPARKPLPQKLEALGLGEWAEELWRVESGERGWRVEGGEWRVKSGQPGNHGAKLFTLHPPPFTLHPPLPHASTMIKQRKRLGLALACGVMRGRAHVGVIQVLEEPASR